MRSIKNTRKLIFIVLVVSTFLFLLTTGVSSSQKVVGADNLDYPDNPLDHWGLENDHTVSKGDNIEGYIESDTVILVEENYNGDNENFPIVIDKENVTIISESGPNSVEINGGNSENVFNLKGGSRFTLIGFEITGGSNRLVSMNKNSSNTKFFHNLFYGSDSSYGIFSLSENLTVENNVFNGCNTGIFTSRSGLELERNTFKNQGDSEVEVVAENENIDDVKIDLNEFSGVGDKSIVFEAENSDLKSSILVENNDFLDGFGLSVLDNDGNGEITENVRAFWNWWGTKYLVEIENKVSENVNFESWYNAPISEDGEIVSGYFRVENVWSSNDIVENESLEVSFKVSKVGDPSSENLKLFDYDWSDEVQDNDEVSGTEEGSLTWKTNYGDGGTGRVKVQSKYDYETEVVDIGKVSYFDVEKEKDLYWLEDEHKTVLPVRVSNIGSREDDQVVRIFRGSEEDDRGYWLDSKNVNLSGEENKVINLSWNPYQEKNIESVCVASDNDDFCISFEESLNLLKDNFYMMDNYSRQLNGEFEESVEVKSWNWVIDEVEYNENDVIGHTYLYRDTEDNLILNSPFIKNDNIESGTVEIRVLAVFEKAGREYYNYDRVSVEVINKVRAEAGGPYEVPEENKIKLNGKKSSGPIDYVNWGLEEYREDMFLIDDNSREPVFYSPSVSENRTFEVRLEVTKGERDPVQGYYYDEATTEIKVFDTSLDAIIGTEEIESGMVENLESDSEGVISEYNWEILNDPTGEAALVGENLESPTFYAPGNLENDVEVKVGLTITNEWKTDNVSKNILIKTIEPSSPENLLVDNERSPQSLKNLSPTISAIYKHKNPTSSAKNMEVVIEENGSSERWEIEKEVDLSLNERGNLKFGEVLAPDTSYGLKVRFEDSSGWGDWASDNFKTDDFLGLDVEEAARFLVSGAPLGTKAETVEEALEQDLDSTMEVIKRLSTSDLAPLLSKMALSPYSPSHSATILEESLLERSVDIVKKMIEAENFEALDKIFYSPELSKDKLVQITEELSEEELATLEKELSGPTKRRIPALSSNEYYITIAIFVAAIIAFVGSLLVIGYILITRTRRRIWNNLIKDFLSGDADKAAVSSNLSPEKEVQRAQDAIDRLELGEKVGLAKKDSKVVLVRKS